MDRPFYQSNISFLPTFKKLLHTLSPEFPLLFHPLISLTLSYPLPLRHTFSTLDGFPLLLRTGFKNQQMVPDFALMVFYLVRD